MITDAVKLRVGRAAEHIARLRRAAAKESLGFFAKTYFPERFNLPFCAMHLDVMQTCEAAMSARGQRIVNAMPPGHGKTSIMTIAHALWAAACHDERSIIIVRSTPPEARRVLSEIGAALEGSERLVRDFPTAAPKPPSAWAWAAPSKKSASAVGGSSDDSGGAFWASQYTSAEPDTRRMHAQLYGDPRAAFAPEPGGNFSHLSDPSEHIVGPPIVLKNGSRIAAVAAGQSLMGQRSVGHRPTLLLFDDPEWEMNSPSGARIMPKSDEFRAWINYWLARLAPRANVFWTGSIVEHGAVMADVMDIRLKAPWDSSGYGAFPHISYSSDEWKECLRLAGDYKAGLRVARQYFEDHKTKLTYGLTPLWPERWDFFDLCMIENGLVGRPMRATGFDARWRCYPCTDWARGAGGWKPCTSDEFHVCRWFGEYGLAVKRDAFETVRSFEELVFWGIRRSEGGKWDTREIYYGRREINTNGRRWYLETIADAAKLGSTAEEADAALAKGEKPWRGEVEVVGEERTERVWADTSMDSSHCRGN